MARLLRFVLPGHPPHSCERKVLSNICSFPLGKNQGKFAADYGVPVGLCRSEWIENV